MRDFADKSWLKQKPKTPRYSWNPPMPIRWAITFAVVMAALMYADQYAEPAQEAAGYHRFTV